MNNVIRDKGSKIIIISGGAIMLIFEILKSFK